MSLLETRTLTCRRGGRLVLDRVSFALDGGEALLLSGANGSGKSTLLRCLAGLLPPAGGTILWQGRDISQAPDAHRARLAWLGHHDGLTQALTTVETLRYASGLDGLAAAPAARRIERALNAFAIAPLADVPVRLLSAGQRRRVALARLLVSPAPLWLLDEPTTGLDGDSTAALELALARHRAGGGLVVVASHLALDLPAPRELALDEPDYPPDTLPPDILPSDPSDRPTGTATIPGDQSGATDQNGPVP
ncbi:MAG: heme ABC exporter ATP-binding protein CcmA [Alphaproteobacteria bacterium]